MAGKHFTNTGQIIQTAIALFAFAGFLFINWPGVSNHSAGYLTVISFLGASVLVLGVFPLLRSTIRSVLSKSLIKRSVRLAAIWGMALFALGFVLCAALFLENAKAMRESSPVDLVQDVQIEIPHENGPVLVKGKVKNSLLVLRAVADFSRYDGNGWSEVGRIDLNDESAPYAGKLVSYRLISKMGPGLNMRLRLPNMTEAQSGLYRFTVKFFIDNVSQFQATEFALDVRIVGVLGEAVIRQVDLTSLPTIKR